MAAVIPDRTYGRVQVRGRWRAVNYDSALLIEGAQVIRFTGVGSQSRAERYVLVTDYNPLLGYLLVRPLPSSTIRVLDPTTVRSVRLG